MLLRKRFRDSLVSAGVLSLNAILTIQRSVGRLLRHWTSASANSHNHFRAVTGTSVSNGRRLVLTKEGGIAVTSGSNMLSNQWRALRRPMYI
eukprot:288565-Amorphochlora_amoeboformis.AAC.1